MQTKKDKASIKVLFIDIGGVLLTNGWPQESRIAAARQFGFDFEEMEKRHNLIFGVYEEGRTTLDDYLHTILFYQERSFTRQDIQAFIFQQSLDLPGMLDELMAWRRRHSTIRVFSLNNEPKELHEYRVATFGLRRVFDGFVTSCHVGLRKPDPAIYKLAIGMAGVKAEDCLYIDDREVLVEAGKRAGLQGWLHQSAPETMQLLHTF